jgi:hypothetical protein
VETAGIIVLLLFLIFAALATVATVRTARAVKRRVRESIDRSTTQARRLVEDNRLRARSWTTPGPAGELARLRLELRASIDSTFRALEEGRREDASLAEAAGLMARLNDHARALDGELRLLEGEPDRERVRSLLPDLADRTHRITHGADSLRWAAQDRARRFAADDLAALTRDIAIESAALKLNPPDEAPGPRLGKD